MTDEQIIKALECCSRDSIKHCGVCPYDEKETDTYCANYLIKDAFKLINRQKSEIEENNLKIDHQAQIIRTLETALADKMAEIERLEAEADTYTTLCKEIHDKVVMNFAERLKKRLWDSTGIDEIVKEMTEGNK